MTSNEKRVLLMDDSPVALDEARRALEAAGYLVQCARDLAELDQIDVGHVDLVLMDVWMPEMYGDDVAVWLKSKYEIEAPIILLSSLDERELAKRAEEAEIHGYICKRAGLPAVVARVRSVLGDAGPEKPLTGPSRVAFLATARQRVRRCHQLIGGGAGNADIIAREMHTLEGEASLVGEPDITIAAEVLRATAVHVGDGDPAALAAALTALEKALEPLRRALKASGPTPVVAAPVAAAPVAAPGATPAATPAASSGRQILMLDDSDFYRSTMLALLEDAGHTVTEARSLAEARQLLHQSQYDLVLLDVNLGDGHGPELIGEVRSVLPRARLALLSAAPGTEVAGVDAVLSKTTETGRLLDQLTELLA